MLVCFELEHRDTEAINYLEESWQKILNFKGVWESDKKFYNFGDVAFVMKLKPSFPPFHLVGFLWPFLVLFFGWPLWLMVPGYLLGFLGMFVYSEWVYFWAIKLGLKKLGCTVKVKRLSPAAFLEFVLWGK